MFSFNISFYLHVFITYATCSLHYYTPHLPTCIHSYRATSPHAPNLGTPRIFPANDYPIRRAVCARKRPEHNLTYTKILLLGKVSFVPGLTFCIRLYNVVQPLCANLGGR